MNTEVEQDVRAAWDRIIATSGFIGGEAVSQFEELWARYCGTDHAVAVANGTEAIELVLRALGIGEGDEVLLPANTFIATAEAVVLSEPLPASWTSTLPRCSSHPRSCGRRSPLAPPR